MGEFRVSGFRSREDGAPNCDGTARCGPPDRFRLAGLVVSERGANLLDVSAVDADGLVQLRAGDAELFRPVGDVRGHLRIDLFRVVWGCGRFRVLGVGSAEFGLLDLFVLVRAGLIGVRHWFVPLSSSAGLDAGTPQVLKRYPDSPLGYILSKPNVS
jgi:hypothetical protein